MTSKFNLTAKFKKNQNIISSRLETGSLLACGLVAGSALMGVILAIPFVIAQSSDALKLVSDHFKPTDHPHEHADFASGMPHTIWYVNMMMWMSNNTLLNRDSLAGCWLCIRGTTTG